LEFDVSLIENCTMKDMRINGSRKYVLKLLALLILIGMTIPAISKPALAGDCCMPIGSGGGTRPT
jgi:hypothetical protein